MFLEKHGKKPSNKKSNFQYIIKLLTNSHHLILWHVRTRIGRAWKKWHFPSATGRQKWCCTLEVELDRRNRIFLAEGREADIVLSRLWPTVMCLQFKSKISSRKIMYSILTSSYHIVFFLMIVLKFHRPKKPSVAPQPPKASTKTSFCREKKLPRTPSCACVTGRLRFKKRILTCELWRSCSKNVVDLWSAFMHYYASRKGLKPCKMMVFYLKNTCFSPKHVVFKH